MEKNKSYEPDGLFIEFQYFWELIRWDLKAFLDDFHEGHISISRNNYHIITLVPKTKDAKQIQKCRSIFLLNVSFKIIIKVLMNRLSKVVGPVISPTQTSFIRGRYIMEVTVVLHVVVNTIHHTKTECSSFQCRF